MSVGAVPSTAENSPSIGLSLAATDHCCPFQRSASVDSWPPGPYAPTAQALLTEKSRTDSRNESSVPPGLGEDVYDHAVPFQCAVSVFCFPAGVATHPTAQASLSLTTETSVNSPWTEVSWSETSQ